LVNLTENALKFSPRGGRVELEAAPSDGGAVISVADEGIGIPAEMQGRIFEKFFMVDGGSTKARGGAGIGLYLAREVVAIHDGAITVESRPGAGSRFEVRLPARPRGAPA